MSLGMMNEIHSMNKKHAERTRIERKSEEYAASDEKFRHDFIVSAGPGEEVWFSQVGQPPKEIWNASGQKFLKVYESDGFFFMIRGNHVLREDTLRHRGSNMHFYRVHAIQENAGFF